MKKFLSMVMAAAMVVSLVPATAFAASGDFKATAKVVDAKNYTEKEIGAGVISGPEAQLTFTTADVTDAGSELTFTFTLDNAKITEGSANTTTGFTNTKTVDEVKASVKGEVTNSIDTKDVVVQYVDEDEFDVTITEDGSKELKRGAILVVAFDGVQMDKISKGKTATVTVDSDDVTVTNGDDLVFASVESKGIKASVKDTVDVATEEVAEIKELKIEPAVGETLGAVAKNGTDIRLKLNSGFEFVKSDLALSTNKGTPVPDVAGTTMK